MTHVRRDLDMTGARNHLKTALWDRHGENISQADHNLVTLYAQGLVALTETREDMDNLTDAEIIKYLTTLVVGLHNNITKGE